MRIMFAAFAVACAAGASAKEPQRIVVQLATPVPSDGALAGGASRWSCAGATCTGPDLNARHGDARACRDLASEVGAVQAYTSARGPLEAAALQKCNAHAKIG